jgi:hypothetical protein
MEPDILLLSCYNKIKENKFFCSICSIVNLHYLKIFITNFFLKCVNSKKFFHKGITNIVMITVFFF